MASAEGADDSDETPDEFALWREEMAAHMAQAQREMLVGAKRRWLGSGKAFGERAADAVEEAYSLRQS